LTSYSIYANLFPETEGTHMAYGDKHTYRDYIITDQYYGFAWAHKDYDLDDPRIGSANTLEMAKREIDNYIEDEENDGA
jgi:hypothetical protein